MENSLHWDISLMYGRNGTNGKEDNACSVVYSTEVCDRDRVRQAHSQQ